MSVCLLRVPNGLDFSRLPLVTDDENDIGNSSTSKILSDESKVSMGPNEFMLSDSNLDLGPSSVLSVPMPRNFCD